MLGVLRAGGDAVRSRSEGASVPLAAVGAAAAAAASRVAVEEAAEGPSLAEIDELVGQSAAAGMVVDLSVEGSTGRMRRRWRRRRTGWCRRR